MNYPISFSFKVVALAPQISVRDAQGTLLLYVKQKLFKLKEAVSIFADEGQSRLLYTIQADRVLDISARYDIRDAQGMPIGAIKREGMRSLWKAHYDILAGELPVMTIREENPWIKLADALIEMIPFAEMFAGYVLHPAYLVARQDGTAVLRLKKQPAFFEGKFTLEQLAPMHADEEQLALLSVLMLLLLERSRG